MMLIIAEKPSLAHAIASAIDSKHKRSEGSFTCNYAFETDRKGKNNETVVTWLLGHVLEQFEPDDYCDEWKRWSIDSLPIIPNEWKLKEMKSAKTVISNVKKLLKEAQVVIHAGDPDREGQLLIDEFLEFFKWKGKTLRLLLKDLTPEAIRKAFTSMRDISEYTGLKNAALARQRADWLVGMNGSRYFTLVGRVKDKNSGVISIGRVQTPTLGLVVRRDVSIENFVPVAYYIISATLKLYAPGSYNSIRSISGVWQPQLHPIDCKYDSVLDDENRLIDLNTTVELVERIKGKEGIVTKYEKKFSSEPPPLPYRLADLQAEANRKFGYTLKQTLDSVQSLYEKQLVSYPRSDCQYLPESHHANAPKIVSGIASSFPAFEKLITASVDFKRKSRAFDDGKVTEHYGITPTGKVANKTAFELTDNELRIFELVCVRYLLQFVPEYEYNSVTAEFEIEGETFRANGRELVNIGWHGWNPKNIVLHEQEDKCVDDADVNISSLSGSSTPFIPFLTIGETGVADDIEVKNKMTVPPKYFTDGTLVKAMSNIHAYVFDPQIKKQLRDIDGIGTSATQYQIVEKLISRGFLRREKKEIRSTDAGRTLIYTLESGNGKSLTHPDMTAVWEQEISKIEHGESSIEQFLDGVYEYLQRIIREDV